jgi:hypothetical protein
LELKFKDCRAKIRQVDSQPTVGNAVVVQVNCLEEVNMLNCLLVVFNDIAQLFGVFAKI